MDRSEESAIDMFLGQLQGARERVWPEGRISGDDDGAAALATHVDTENDVLKIIFANPTLWIGLDLEAAIHMRGLIDDFIGGRG